MLRCDWSAVSRSVEKGILKTVLANVQDVSGVGGRAPYLALRMQQPAGGWKAHGAPSAADPHTPGHDPVSKKVKWWKEEQRGCADLLLSPLQVPGDSLWSTPRR